MPGRRPQRRGCGDRYRGTVSTPDTPEHDGADLEQIREEIDALQEKSTDELISPEPSTLLENEPTPEPTDAIGSEKWDEPADEETLDD